MAGPTQDQTCGVTRDGVTCDREQKHTGNHRGYNAQIDEPMFWADRPDLSEYRALVEFGESGAVAAYVERLLAQLAQRTAERDAAREDLPVLKSVWSLDGRSLLAEFYDYAYFEKTRAAEQQVQALNGQIGRLSKAWQDEGEARECAERDKYQAEQQAQTLRQAILWALGERDHFPAQGRGKRYWWRTELRKRAGAVLRDTGPSQS